MSAHILSIFTDGMRISESKQSSLSDDAEQLNASGYISKAIALVDYQPSPYDNDALKFKVNISENNTKRTMY